MINGFLYNSYIAKIALCAHAERWPLASGTMDSHLLAVSGVSSCLQRNQDESKRYALRLRSARGTQARRVGSTKKRDFIFENHPTRSYLTHTQARSRSYQSVDVISL